MTVTAKDLRFNTSKLFDLISKGEEILITYRGKAKARLVPPDAPSDETKSDAAFGMWADREEDVNAMVRRMRAGRDLGL